MVKDMVEAGIVLWCINLYGRSTHRQCYHCPLFRHFVARAAKTLSPRHRNNHTNSAQTPPWSLPLISCVLINYISLNICKCKTMTAAQRPHQSIRHKIHICNCNHSGVTSLHCNMVAATSNLFSFLPAPFSLPPLPPCPFAFPAASPATSSACPRAPGLHRCLPLCLPASMPAFYLPS